MAGRVGPRWRAIPQCPVLVIPLASDEHLFAGVGDGLAPQENLRKKMDDVFGAS